MIGDPMSRRRGCSGLRGALLVPITASLLALSSCGADPPDDPAILAVFDGGQVTVEDLDRAILALPPGERQAQLSSPERLETIVQRLAFNKIIENKLDAFDLESHPSYLAIMDSIRRRAVVGIFLRSRDLVTPVEPDDLRSWIDRHPELRDQSPQRLVLTFFKAFTPGASKEQTVEEVRNVLRRVENGETFSRLAEQESDSETRHNGGHLGWISTGQLAPDLERIIFSLDEGEISEPITTRDGVHLFFVKSAVEERRLGDSELTTLAKAEIFREQTDDALAKAMVELGVAEPALPSPETLRAATRSSDPALVILEVGGRSFDLEELQLLMHRTADTFSGDAEELLVELARVEALRQDIEERKLVSEAEVARSIAPTMRQERLAFASNLKISEWIAGDEDRLRRAYETEPTRYMTPLTLHALKLSVPLGEDPVVRMRRLEQRVAGSGAGDLEAIAAEMNGTVRDLGRSSLAQLIASEPGVLAAVPCAEGELSPPHRTIDGLIVYGIVKRIDPQQRPFDQARDMVVQTLLRDQGSELQEEFSLLILRQNGFLLFTDRVRDPILFPVLT